MTETTCFISKMPLAEKHCNYRLSVLAHNGMCAERAKNALLRTKTLGSQRSTVSRSPGDAGIAKTAFALVLALPRASTTGQRQSQPASEAL